MVNNILLFCLCSRPFLSMEFCGNYTNAILGVIDTNKLDTWLQYNSMTVPGASIGTHEGSWDRDEHRWATDFRDGRGHGNRRRAVVLLFVCSSASAILYTKALLFSGPPWFVPSPRSQPVSRTDTRPRHTRSLLFSTSSRSYSLSSC
jgi:hypothetical protein